MAIEALTCPTCRKELPNIDVANEPPAICPFCRHSLAPTNPAAGAATVSNIIDAGSASNGSSQETLDNITQPTSSNAGGANVPGYEILSTLGQGGMGVVYKARHLKLQRIVALKMIIAGAHAGARETARFRTEAEAVARLQHPNIVQIYEIGEWRAGDVSPLMPYFSLEFCGGGSLADRLNGTPLPAKEAAQLVETLARAMQAAHDADVIHRDLKPANVLLASGGRESPDNSQATVGPKQSGDLRPPLAHGVLKITDFGLAKKLDDVGQTQSGSIMGTPSYMAPEQAGGNTRDIGPLADVYALGAILYELLTGRPPFKGVTPVDTIMQVIHQEPVPPSQLQSKTPGDLETICLKCLQKTPGKRYASALELAEDLRRFQAGEPIVARPVGRLERGWRWCRRNPVVAGLMGAVAATLIVGTTVAWMFALRAEANAVNARAKEKLANGQTTIAKEKEKIATEKTKLADEERKKADDQRQKADEERKKAVQAEQAEKQRSKELQVALEEVRTQKKAADDNWTRSEWKVYAGNITLAQAAWQENNASLVHQYLSKCRWDFRGWEHHYLWTVVNSNQITFKGHTREVSSVAFSPDGKKIVSGGGDPQGSSLGELKVWDVVSRQVILTLKGHTGLVSSVAFRPDGKQIVSGSHDRTLKVWDVATGEETLTLRGHRSRVESVAFSPNGRLIVSGSYDNTLKVWDAASGQDIRTLSGASSVAFSADGKHIVTGGRETGQNGQIKVWDVGSGKEIRTLSRIHGANSVAFSPDGKTIVTTSLNNTLRVWDAVSGQGTLTLKGHTDRVSSVGFSPDGQQIISGSYDGTLKIWDPASGQENLTLKGHSSWVTSVAFRPDGGQIVSGSYDGTLKIWDGASGQETRTLEGHTHSVSRLAFSPDGRQIVSGSYDKTLKVWDVASGDETLTVGGHSSWVTSVAFSPDGRQIVSGSYDKTLKVWDATRGQEIRTLREHTGVVTSVAFSPDGRQIVSGSYDKTLKVWDAASGQDIRTLKGHTHWITSVALRPDGRQIVSGSADKTLKVWDATSGQDIRTLNGHTNPVTSVAFSPDGKQIVSGSLDKTLKVWDAASGQDIRTLKGHLHWVTSVAFSPDGQQIVSRSADNTLKVWDAASGQETLSLKGQDISSVADVSSVAFSPDGKQVVSASTDGTLKVWDASSSYPRPTTGTPIPELTAFDQAMQKFMRERRILAGTLAVAKDGRLVLARGYGYRDTEATRSIAFDVPMRLASGSKPITAAAILALIRAGKLTFDTRVFPLLGVTAPPGQIADPRLNDITVQHLLKHQSGWDMKAAFDPMFRTVEIAEALGKPGPASSDDVVQYMAGQPLQFAPGTKTAYSNFGYCLLGRVIEKGTGKPYAAHVQEFLAPLGIKSVKLARTLPANRNPREPWYSDPGTGRNVMQPGSPLPAPAADGTFHLEAMDAHGGLIGSAPDLVRFLEAYWITGEPRTAEAKATLTAYGSLPGTFTMLHQRPDGVSMAVLFNQRANTLENESIKDVLDAAADGIKQWPVSWK